jgi:predicted component of type VI protein secretion system
MNSFQILKARREDMRWHLMRIAYACRPTGINTAAMLPIIQSVYPDASQLEVRKELDYLEERELVKIAKDPLDNWWVELRRYGVDLVEYAVECDPGISRPRITQA